MVMRLKLAAVLVLSFIGTSSGHDHWINRGNFISPIDGIHCCGEEDCAPLDPRDVSESAGGYFIASLQEFVPPREVQSSRDGQFWRCKAPDGARRCFFAPPPGS